MVASALTGASPYLAPPWRWTTSGLLRQESCLYTDWREAAHERSGRFIPRRYGTDCIRGSDGFRAAQLKVGSSLRVSYPPVKQVIFTEL